MTRRHRRRCAVAAAVTVLLAYRQVDAQDAESQPELWHFKSAPTCTTARGTVLSLPIGYYVADNSFARLDAELRRAQDVETRLTAENTSLRKSAADGPSWTTPVVVAVSAFAAGIAVGALASR